MKTPATSSSPVAVARRSAGAPPETASEAGSTRDAVVRLLLDRPASAADIALRLGISAAGVRRHLDALAEDGAVVSRELRTTARRGRGRPAREYRLTDAGRSRLPQAYDVLAAEALQYLAEVGGDAAVTEFARRRAEAVLAPHRDALDDAPDTAARAAVLSAALSEAGFSASVAEVNGGRQLCQHHCPVAHVAAAFPQLCQAELDVFAEALGSHAQRIATIAHGDSFCTTFVPGAAGPADESAPPLHHTQDAPDRATATGRTTTP